MPRLAFLLELGIKTGIEVFHGLSVQIEVRQDCLRSFGNAWTLLASGYQRLHLASCYFLWFLGLKGLGCLEVVLELNRFGHFALEKRRDSPCFEGQLLSESNLLVEVDL